MIKKIAIFALVVVVVVGALSLGFLALDPWDVVDVQLIQLDWSVFERFIKRPWRPQESVEEAEEVEEEPTEEAVEEAVEVEPTLTPEPEDLIHTDWFTATGVSESAEAKKEASVSCTLPAGCNVVGEPGVLGADSLEDAEANESAVWTGSFHHQIGDQNEMGLLIPQGSYATAYASGMTLKGKGFELVLPEFGWDGVWGLLVRGSHDYPLATSLTNHGAPGALGYTRYPVPSHAGEYFSEDYLTAQAANSLQFDNCHADGCLELRQAIFDVNDMTLTILRYTAEEGWKVLWTNVQDPTP